MDEEITRKTAANLLHLLIEIMLAPADYNIPNIPLRIEIPCPQYLEMGWKKSTPTA